MRPRLRYAIEFAILSVIVGSAAISGCGGDSSDSDSAVSAGAGGGGAESSGGRVGTAGKRSTGTAGKPGKPSGVACGTSTCKGVTVSTVTIPGCCADAAANLCGLDSSGLAMFDEAFAAGCQPLAKPGTKDPGCAESPPVPIPNSNFTVTFKGCCQESGTCGYNVDSIGGVISLGLGCVDAAPFLDGGRAVACGAAAPGAGGSPQVSVGGSASIGGRAGGGGAGSAGSSRVSQGGSAGSSGVSGSGG